jgi:3-oxoacyl-(acyl-carrier-protein) synthase
VTAGRRGGEDELAVTGVGMVSALGFDVVTSCAAARANISRARELADELTWDEETAQPQGTYVHDVPLLTEGFVGLARLVRLGAAALQDLAAQVDLAQWPRLGMVLNVPSGFHFEQQFRPDPGDEPLPPAFEEQVMGELGARREAVERRLIARLAALTKIAVVPAASRVVFGDEAGLVMALQEARRWLDQGTIDACIVGGIDSLVDPETLQALHALAIVKTPDQPVGRMPGEAAAMVLVEDARKAVYRRGTRPTAVLGGLALETEPKHRFATNAHTGKALYQSVRATLASLAPAEGAVDLVIGDLTGEEFRAREWGWARIRLAEKQLLPATVEWYPSLAFGAVGAAAGPAAICMACRGFARGYAPPGAALVWLLADAGARASLWIRRTNA